MPSIKSKKPTPDRKEHPGLITLLKTKLTPFKGETITLELSKNMEPVENPLEPQKAVCGHVLHPVGAPESLWMCPACHVNDSLDSLRRIAKSWAKFGGPDHEKITSVQDYATYRTRWHVTKARLLNYMDDLEQYAEEEKNLELEHPGAVAETFGEAALNIMSSQAALTRARLEMPLCDILASDFKAVKPSNSPESQKLVRFAKGTIQLPRRSVHSFHRTGTGYKPGRWAASSGETWLNTSFANLSDYQKTVYEAELDTDWNAAGGDTKEATQAAVQILVDGDVLGNELNNWLKYHRI